MFSMRVSVQAFALLLEAALFCTSVADPAVFYPAQVDGRPGHAQASLDAERQLVVLWNRVLEVRLQLNEGYFQHGQISNIATSATLHLSKNMFAIGLASHQIDTSMLRVALDSSSGVRGFHLERVMPTNDSRAGSWETGWRADLLLSDINNTLQVRWSAELRDGAGYMRQVVELAALDHPLDLAELTLFRGQVPNSEKAGSVQGVPVTTNSFFLGYEHPQSENMAIQDQVRCFLKQKRRIEPDGRYSGSLVIGVSPPSQTRRAFWHYLERERAHPTRPMLHYNSWYDLGTGLPFTAEASLKTLDQIASQLAKRGVKLDAFLFDDGWDDPDSGPWDRHSGFSNSSLRQLEQLAEQWGTGLGVWFSPFGGYHEPRQRRLAAARKAFIPIREETRKRIPAVLKGKGVCSKEKPCKEGEGDCNSDDECEGSLTCFVTQHGTSPPGVDTSGIDDPSHDFCFDAGVQSGFLGLGIPKYYRHFRDVLADWLKSGAVLFKLDGIGNPSGFEQTLPEDFDAAVKLIAELRRLSREIFINLSTGTWPSPFWLMSSDTVWRRGHDHYFAGEGPARERWITYRDAMVYQHVVSVSPLFPLNSLMIHGVVFAKDAWDLTKPEGAGDGLSELPFRHEVRAAFGSGTMLQELYLTPSLLSREHWDDLAEAANWGRSRSKTLADVHWVGGDPEKGEAYGWAAWRDGAVHNDSASAVLTLRNPTSIVQTISLDARDIFGLPVHAGYTTLQLNSPFGDQRPRFLRMKPGYSTRVRLKPFALVVFDTQAPQHRQNEWEWIDDWLDPMKDNIMPSLWLFAALTFGVWMWRSSEGGGGPSSAQVPVEELRRRRLEALERRTMTVPISNPPGTEGLSKRQGVAGS
mmetsp:Transcript_112652/g.224029  ORF Transcript_112652/g.224029 Transcript_112652/m.224029 type:complete len:863 (+) Transcript_112652:33-2621(+)